MRQPGTRQKLLLLKTPPPFGGGEILQAHLRDHYAAREGYDIVEVCSKKRDKTNQGALQPWKVAEFVGLWFRIVCRLVRTRPSCFFMNVGKGTPHFLRDSLLLWPCFALGVPVFLELHGAGFPFLGHNRAMTAYARSVLSRIASIRVLGESVVQDLERHGIMTGRVIDNGIEVGTLPALGADGHGSLLPLLFVGTLSPGKGFHTLVETMGLLAGVGLELHCMGIWHSEAFRQQMIDRVKELDLDSRIVFHGLCRGEKKWQTYEACDVLVLPSRSEGQPLVILEAFAYGLAVVATTVGAVADTVPPGHGLLVPPDDVSALVNAIRELANNRRSMNDMGRRNQDLYRQRYAMDVFLRNHEEWLTHVI